jgi:hypothetical protein
MYILANPTLVSYLTGLPLGYGLPFHCCFYFAAAPQLVLLLSLTDLCGSTLEP